MKMVTTDHLREVRAAHEPPCISLYQPTHRHHPNNKQDPIRFRNLVDGAERCDPVDRWRTGNQQQLPGGRHE